MKLSSFTLGMIAICAISAFNCEALAQSRLISSNEFLEGTTKKNSDIFMRSRRVVSTNETISDGIIQKTVLTISEYLLPGRKRFYIKTTEGDKVTETEQINIDHMQYDRKDGGAWTKFDTRQSGYGTGVGTGMGAGIPQSCDQFSVEPAVLNGRSMQLFEMIAVEGSGKELLLITLRRWIGDDGFPYRSESTKGKLYPRDERQRFVTTYEYDPIMGIEAPIK